MSDNTTPYHPAIIAALRAAESARKFAIESVYLVAGIQNSLELHRLADGSIIRVYEGYVSCIIYPDSVGHLAPFLKEVRDNYGSTLRPDIDAAGGRICYYDGPFFISAYFNKSCTFKKVGEEIVIKPIYELKCEGVPA